MRNPKLSVAIPTWEMRGVGVQMLERNLEVLETQTFKDFEVVISDNSSDLGVWNLCRTFDLNINYEKNLVRGNSANRNNAMRLARGELIKMLDQDDYLADENSLQDIVDNFAQSDMWMMTGCSNNPHPFYSNVNTLGSPTVMTIRNGLDMWFREDLNWVLDLDFYKRMVVKYGLPKILDKVNVIIGLGAWQETNNVPLEEKLREEQL